MREETEKACKRVFSLKEPDRFFCELFHPVKWGAWRATTGKANPNTPAARKKAAQAAKKAAKKKAAFASSAAFSALELVSTTVAVVSSAGGTVLQSPKNAIPAIDAIDANNLDTTRTARDLPSALPPTAGAPQESSHLRPQQSHHQLFPRPPPQLSLFLQEELVQTQSKNSAKPNAKLDDSYRRAMWQEFKCDRFDAFAEEELALNNLETMEAEFQNAHSRMAAPMFKPAIIDEKYKQDKKNVDIIKQLVAGEAEVLVLRSDFGSTMLVLTVYSSDVVTTTSPTRTLFVVEPVVDLDDMVDLLDDICSTSCSMWTTTSSRSKWCK